MDIDGLQVTEGSKVDLQKKHPTDLTGDHRPAKPAQVSLLRVDRVFRRIINTVLHRAVYMFFLPFSRRRRYLLALRLSKYLEPFAKFAGHAEMPPFALDTHREYLTARVLQSLTHSDIEFDPVIKVEGAERIPETGAVLVSGHFYLNFLFLRWLRDQRRAHSVFLRLGVDDWRILGTREQLSVLSPGNLSLLRVRELIRSGELVVAAIDNHEPFPGWRKIDFEAKEIFISETLLKFAERIDQKVLFFETHLCLDGSVAATVVSATTCDPSQTFNEFSSFLCRSLSKRLNL